MDDRELWVSIYTAAIKGWMKNQYSVITEQTEEQSISPDETAKLAHDIAEKIADIGYKSSLRMKR